MPQRNNPMSAVQKKRTVSTTKRKGTTSSSKTSRTSKKEQVKHRTVMPTWLRNILAVIIAVVLLFGYYLMSSNTNKVFKIGAIILGLAIFLVIR